MSIKYLSSSGLTEVWGNIKAYIASKIPSKIVTGLSIKGRTITYTNSDGTTGTLTTQDTNTTYSVATTSTNGLMSSTDKTKLDGIAAGANNYTHPSSHPASMITGLTKVATSGSYNDLTNKPTIPTVNNATLTIQKNGTTVKTFTANASANVTANITVPTKTSELTNNSGFLTSHNPVDSSLSSTSTNAIQNKVVNAALNNKANDTDVVHKSGAETIVGTKTFSDDVNISKIRPYYNVFSTGYIKGQAPTSTIYSGLKFHDDINSGSTNDITGSFEIEYSKDGYNRILISSRNYAGTTQRLYHVGLRVPNDNTRSVDFVPSVNDGINLGTSSYKWKGVYATTFYGNLKGSIDSSTTATTQASTDNSTKIATTAWVRTYVNSVVGSSAVGTTITAFWGSSSSTGDKWANASGIQGTKRVSSTSSTFTPVVGQIYSGNQLYSTATANGGVGTTDEPGPAPNVVYARLDLSGAFNSSYKYLCTTAVGVNVTASVDVTGHTAYSSSGPYTTITSYSGFTKTLQGGKSTFLRVQ